MKFNFYMPTRIIMGTNCIIEQSSLLAELGKRAFILTGNKSAERNGSLADMTAALKKENIYWEIYNKAKPNPALEDVRAAAKAARSFGADIIIALGGGSPMDTAKAVAVLAAEEVSDDALLSKRSFGKVLPLVLVPTTAGTGSEVTPYSILTNHKLQTKSFLNSEQIYPKIAFLDGRYTLDLPPSVTAATLVDALSHALEGYLAVRAIPIGQCLALESLRIIGGALLALAQGRTFDLATRDNILYASMLAGIVISQSGTTAVHAMGYSLTYFKGIDHGIANGLLMAEYLRFIQRERPDEVEILLEALGVSSVSALEVPLKKIVGSFSLNKDEAKQFAEIASNAGNIQNTQPKPTQEVLETMLTNCFVK